MEICIPVRMLASSSWLGWLASLMLDDAEENGRSRLHGEVICGPRSSASSSGGRRVDEARDDLSPTEPPHQPQPPDLRFGLYRGGPRNGTVIPPVAHQNKYNRAKQNQNCFSEMIKQIGYFKLNINVIQCA